LFRPGAGAFGAAQPGLIPAPLAARRCLCNSRAARNVLQILGRMTAIATPDAADERRLALDFDPAHPAPGFYEDPYPVYPALLRHDPVHRCPDGSLFLSRHAHLSEVYRNPRLFSSDKQ